MFNKKDTILGCVWRYKSGWSRDQIPCDSFDFHCIVFHLEYNIPEMLHPSRQN